MITLSLLEFLYLILIFFGVIISTLFVLILIRILKILGVISEITEYYYTLKKYYKHLMQVIEVYTQRKKETSEESKKSTLK